MVEIDKEHFLKTSTLRTKMAKSKVKTAGNESREESVKKAKVTLENIIEVIKDCIRKGKLPPQALISRAKELALLYPELASLKEEILQLNEKAIQEAVAYKLFNSLEGKINPYSSEQYLKLLKRENDYFNNIETQERHQLMHMMMTGARIDDDDPSGRSITTKKAIEFFDDISSDAIRIERQEASELLAHDAKRFKEKRRDGIPLTQPEQIREKQVHKRVEKVVQEELYDAHFQKHKAMHAAEVGKRVEEVTTEEVVRARGNRIIEDVVSIFPKIKEAFKGIEDRLAALVFHNPQAIHEHHDNIEQLKVEAEIAHQRQQAFEQEKKEQNQKKQEKVAKLLSKDLRKIKARHDVGISFTDTEKAKEKEVQERVQQVLEKVISTEAPNISSGIQRAFRGEEDKLADLLLHNPQAIHEHRDNIEQLRAEAEIAHQQQVESERAKVEENNAKEVQKAKEEFAQTSRAEELTEKVVETKDSKITQATEQKTTEEKKAKPTSKLEAMKAKKEAEKKAAAEAEAKKAVDLIKTAGIVAENVTTSSISPDHTPITRTGLDKENFHSNQ